MIYILLTIKLKTASATFKTTVCKYRNLFYEELYL